MKISKIPLFAFLAAFVSCQNFDKDFPDFEYTTGYFPYQYPIRTLVLGDDIYDNTNDNNHTFLISVAMGGGYENSENRIFHIAIDASLCNKVLFGENGDTIRSMPEHYFSLDSDKIVIPKGKFNGGVKVKLSQSFFDDPLATKETYVVPLRITKADNIDSVLVGYSLIENPDSRSPLDWNIIPKDYTMFAVKYVNPYHANYLHKGVSNTRDASGTILEERTYSSRFVEQNEVWKLTTVDMNTVVLNEAMHSTYFSHPAALELTFQTDGRFMVGAPEGASYSAVGEGRFVKDAEEWGNKRRNAIYFEYTISSEDLTYSARDTLIVRDRGIVMETYSPVLF